MASTIASRRSVRVGSFVQPSATLILEESATTLRTKVHTNFISSTLPLSSSHFLDFSSCSKLGGRSKQPRRCPRQRRPSNTSPHGAHYADAFTRSTKIFANIDLVLSIRSLRRACSLGAVVAREARLAVGAQRKSARCPARFRRHR